MNRYMKKNYFDSTGLNTFMNSIHREITDVLDKVDTNTSKINNHSSVINELSRYDNELENRLINVDKQLTTNITNIDNNLKKINSLKGDIDHVQGYCEIIDRAVQENNEKLEESNLLKVMMNYIVPIGTVITNSKSSFNPNTIYPGTSWTRIKGRVIVGLDENDTDFNSSGKTGGYKSFNNSHNHSTQNCTLTINQIPSHSHEMVSTSGRNVGISLQPFQMTTQNTSLVDPNVCRATGGGQPHNHGYTTSSQGTQSLLQPYITKYVWERTA